jgi:hypothetical protein
MPFTRSFERHVDHELPRPLKDALMAVRPLPNTDRMLQRAQRNQWRVVCEVVRNGETETEACRLRLGMSDYTFQVAALNGLLAFRSALLRAG